MGKRKGEKRRTLAPPTELNEPAGSLEWLAKMGAPGLGCCAAWACPCRSSKPGSGWAPARAKEDPNVIWLSWSTWEDRVLRDSEDKGGRGEQVKRNKNRALIEPGEVKLWG